MSVLTELIRQHGLTTTKQIHYMQWGWNQPPNPAWLPKREELKKAYGDKLDCSSSSYASAHFKCDAGGKCAHWIYVHDDYFAYSWPGQNYLVSKTPITIDILHELIKAKSDELEVARKKRFETIKSPRDAIRIIFRDSNIKVNMVGGNPRLDCGPFDIEFSASKDDSDPQVKVAFIYRSGDYKNSILLTTLTIADPDFSKRVEAIAFNGQNLNKLMLGEIQPRLVK